MRDISKSLFNIKIILAIITIISTCLTIYIIKTAFDNAATEREYIYILDKKNTLKLALSQNVNVNRIAEAEAHIKRFHELFFILSADADFIESNMSKALDLADESVKQQYNLLMEQGYFTSLIASGISSEFICDSINLYNSTTHDIDAVLYGKTSLVHSDKIVYKTIKTSCSLISTQRTINNPNGFQICNWNIIDNSVIGQIKRKNLLDKVNEINNNYKVDSSQNDSLN